MSVWGIFGAEGIKVKSLTPSLDKGMLWLKEGFPIFGLSRLLLSRSGVFYLFEIAFCSKLIGLKDCYAFCRSKSVNFLNRGDFFNLGAFLRSS